MLGLRALTADGSEGRGERWLRCCGERAAITPWGAVPREIIRRMREPRPHACDGLFSGPCLKEPLSSFSAAIALGRAR